MSSADPAPAPPSPQVGTRSKEVRWYTPTLETLDTPARELLEQYSEIPSEKVIPHITEVRERAWEIFPYPCIGQFRFLELSISMHPAYKKILKRLKGAGEGGEGGGEGQTLLDMGCCFAQDIRKLVFDGVVGSRLYACDLAPEFLDLGYDLFLDRDKIKAKFFTADVFQEDGELSKLEGKIDVIYAASFLHLFSWDNQIKVCKRMIKVLKPKKGSTVFGRQVGEVKATERKRWASGQDVWRHDEESFIRMWQVVGEETGTKWGVETDMLSGWGLGGSHTGNEVRRLWFEVVRVD